MTKEQPKMVALCRLSWFHFCITCNWRGQTSSREDKLSLGRKKLEFLAVIFAKKKTLSFNFAFRCSYKQNYN